MKKLGVQSITKKQYKMLEFIVESSFPTYIEIQEKFGYKSPNSVTQNLKALVKKGYLHYDDEGYSLTLKSENVFGKYKAVNEYERGFYQAKLETELTNKRASEMLGISHSNLTKWKLGKTFSAYQLLKFLERTNRYNLINNLMEELGVLDTYVRIKL
jgi:hypothetical protein